MTKPILCLDFDGVCHAYTSGWQGADVVSDPPVPGLFDFLAAAGPHFDLQVFSARSGQPGGIPAMQAWFERHHQEWLAAQGRAGEPLPVSFPVQKPHALITLDDRALTFTGQWPAIDFLRNFQPWYKSAGTPPSDPGD